MMGKTYLRTRPLLCEMKGKAAGALARVGLGLVGAFVLGVIVTRILDEIFHYSPLERVKSLEWNIYYLE